jgi:hypothetical protein
MPLPFSVQKLDAKVTEKCGRSRDFFKLYMASNKLPTQNVYGVSMKMQRDQALQGCSQ